LIWRIKYWFFNENNAANNYGAVTVYKGKVTVGWTVGKGKKRKRKWDGTSEDGRLRAKKLLIRNCMAPEFIKSQGRTSSNGSPAHI